MIAIVPLSQETNEQKSDRWLTVTEVAKRLRVDKLTVRRRIYARELRAHHEGKVY